MCPNIDVTKPNSYDSIVCIFIYLLFLKKYKTIIKYG